MRDGLKKRIHGTNKNNTLTMVKNFPTYKSGFNKRIASTSCYSRVKCGKYEADTGKYYGNPSEYKRMFRQPVRGWRKQISCVEDCSANGITLQGRSRADPITTEIYKDPYAQCTDCPTDKGSRPNTRTPNILWGMSRARSGINTRTSKSIVRSGMQPNTAGQQNSGKPCSNKYSYSYRELLNNRRKHTFEKQIATQKSNNENNSTTGYGGECCCCCMPTAGVVSVEQNAGFIGFSGAFGSSNVIINNISLNYLGWYDDLANPGSLSDLEEKFGVGLPGDLSLNFFTDITICSPNQSPITFRTANATRLRDSFNDTTFWLWSDKPELLVDGMVLKVSININCKENGKNKVIFKPNNKNYQIQGAVDSSTRLDRIKLNTIRGESNCPPNLTTTQTGKCNGIYFAGKSRFHGYKYLFHKNHPEGIDPQLTALARVRGARSKIPNLINGGLCCKNNNNANTSYDGMNRYPASG